MGSMWSHPVPPVALGNPDDGSVGTDLAKGGAGVASSLATGAAAASTVPVAGWVAGGVMAATAGTIAIVQGIKRRRVNKAQALAWARRMKLPRKDAENVAGFVIKLQKRDASWRRATQRRLSARLARVKSRQAKWRARPGARRTLQVLTLGIMRGPRRLANQRRRLEAKLGLIRALETTRKERRIERREQRREDLLAAQMPQQTEIFDVEQDDTAPGTYGGLPVWAWVVVAGSIGGAVYLLRKGKE